MATEAALTYQLIMLLMAEAMLYSIYVRGDCARNSVFPRMAKGGSSHNRHVPPAFHADKLLHS